jgi:hypothetical protein
MMFIFYRGNIIDVHTINNAIDGFINVLDLNISRMIYH